MSRCSGGQGGLYKVPVSTSIRVFMHFQVVKQSITQKVGSRVQELSVGMVTQYLLPSMQNSYTVLCPLKSTTQHLQSSSSSIPFPQLLKIIKHGGKDTASQVYLLLTVLTEFCWKCQLLLLCAIWSISRAAATVLGIYHIHFLAVQFLS